MVDHEIYDLHTLSLTLQAGSYMDYRAAVIYLLSLASYTVDDYSGLTTKMIH